jgi:hypothetical protein
MRTNPLLDPILDDDALTRGLGDEEARVLVEWLVDWAERLALEPGAGAAGRASALHRRGRAIARFVEWWGHRRTRAAAVQLAATERFAWPLPPPDVDPCELMEQIVAWEDVAGRH